QREDLPNDFLKWTSGGRPLRLDTVKQLLPDGTSLLQYCVLDDRTYVWTVSNRGFDFHQLKAGEGEIKGWTTALQSFASQRDAENFESALAAPYQGLLAAPLATVAASETSGRTPKVIVIPDRSMHGLPFSALKNGTRYAVRDYAISVDGSATLYAFSVAQNRKRSGAAVESVALFADPAFNSRLDISRGLSRLRRARSETARIEKLYAPVLEVVRRMDDAATVPELLRLARRSAVIHVAVHGIANPDTPSRSFLLLAPAENDSGALEAERLLKELRVENARLAVLSACSSAGGTPVGPEGLAPLVRPVIAAGVPGVVGTLWNVSDSAATEELLVRFHQHYRDGEDAASALRLAQLEMLEDPDLEFHSAIAWAPFQMIGAASSPFPVSPTKNRR
ncbi:MAG: hypothetical protein QOJ98_3223, partial [Acidobacteriota bacterium]|nr:hypothetical protein [Acidobacteriota bacterium]